MDNKNAMEEAEVFDKVKTAETGNIDKRKEEREREREEKIK